MSEMVERVARAIAKRIYGDDGYRDEDDGVQYWELCEDHARAAIEAMREPTDEMVMAVWSGWGPALEADYQSMIKAALGSTGRTP